MTVFQATRPPHHWYYDFEEGGARYAKKCVDPDDGSVPRNKTEARRIEDKIRQRVRQGNGADARGILPGVFTLAQAMDLHLANNVGSSALHQDNLNNYAAEILGFFGAGTAVTAIGAPRIAQYKKFCAEQTVWVWKGGPRKRDGIARQDKRFWKNTGRSRSASSCNHHLDCLRGALLAAHATKDPVTGQPMLPFPPTVEAFDIPKRQAAPMPEQELAARKAVARPWVQDALDLARLFGLRKTEALIATVRHIRVEIRRDQPYRYLSFRGEEQKGGDDVKVHGGSEGSDLLARLQDQAHERGADHLVTWPGLAYVRATDRGETDVEPDWHPLKSFRRSFQGSAKQAGIVTPHRYHDVRARYITELAKYAPARVVQKGARHADFGTTQIYIDAAELDVASAVDLALSQRPTVHVVEVPAGEQKVKPLPNKKATESQARVPSKKKSRSRRTG